MTKIVINISNIIDHDKYLSPHIYFMYEEYFIPGTVLISNSNTTWTNLLNPSPVPHGGIYFGKGLKSYLLRTNESLLNNFPYIRDDIPYVIESLELTVPTDIFTYLSKSISISLIYFHVSSIINKNIMFKASRNACEYLGNSYSLKTDGSGYYCFEIIVLSYKKEIDIFNSSSIKFMDKKYYLSTTFINPLHWVIIWSTSNRFVNHHIKYRNNNLCSLLIT